MFFRELFYAIVEARVLRIGIFSLSLYFSLLPSSVRIHEIEAQGTVSLLYIKTIN